VARRKESQRRDPLDVIIGELPDRFLRANIDVGPGGEMLSLRAYTRDLTNHLSQAGHDVTPGQVMAALGIPPSEWYRIALSEGAGAGILGYRPEGGPETPRADGRGWEPRREFHVIDGEVP
jgi:hypothetical protein